MKKTLMKNKKGISMVSLAVTVIVLIILALLAVYNSTSSVDNANKSAFLQELKDVEEGVANKRITNQIAGTGEEILNKGFYKVTVTNPPASFTSFDKNLLTGYVVDLELIQFEDSIRGQKYKDYKAGSIERVNFGKDDVYVYDANGVVYYAKGVAIQDTLYYSAEELNADGPIIVSKMVNMAANKKSATIEVVVRAMAEGKLSLTIGGKKANVVSENGNETTFSLPVYENKTYMLVATEVENGSTSQSIDVTEIDTPTYKIIYDANGGTNEPPQETKTENITLTLSLQSPKREGYTFMGWSTKRESTLAEYKPGSEFTTDENTTLYAVWLKGEKTYNVLYSANGGAGAPPAEFNIKETYTISLQVPRKEGFGFDGWSKNPKATVAEYHPGDVISIDSDIELYAVWISNAQTVTITVEPEGAATTVGSGAKQKGENVVIAATAKDGYEFESWKVTSGSATLASTVSSTTSFKMPAGDVSIVANLKAVYLTLRYDANGGYNAPATQRGAENSTIQISENQPTRDGYKFKGWALRSSATEADYTSAGTIELKESIVLYAVWEKDIAEYTLSFDLNGGKEETPGDFAPITTKAGEKKQIPAKEPIRKGYVFLGWTLEKSSKDVVYKSGDTFEKDKNTVLYAIFKDIIAPEITMSVHYDDEQLVLEAEAFDDGIITGYKWTTTNEAPTTWNADGTGNTTLVKENSAITNGENYFWAKDYAGNVSSAMIMVYEVVYDANGGDNAPQRQLKAQGVPLTLSGVTPTRDEFKFLGWSTSVNPDNTLASVTYVSGDAYETDANATLKAVWGQASFELSTYIVDLAVGEPAQQITITKSPFTGDLKVTTSNEKVATAEIIGDILKITPGTAAGDATITITESTMGVSRKVLARIEKGQRTITLTKDAFSFTYGDGSATTVISYEGEQTRTEIISTNEAVATATASGYTITVTPHNFGTTKLTIVVLENDAFYEKTADVQVVVAKKDLIVTPDAGQSKVYDKTTSTPQLTYKYTGQINGETPKFEGTLSRAAEKDVGTYKIELGNLKLVDNGAFKAANYNLKLHETPVNFEITHMYVPVPTIKTSHTYDGTEKYPLEEGVDYKRGGVYAATDAGTYNLQVLLADTKNTLWADSKNTVAKNFTWKINAYSLADGIATGNVTIDPVNAKVYTGAQLTPSVTIEYKGKTLIQGTDYTLKYANNVNVGTATITITGIGNYSGTTTTTFKITNAAMQVDAYGYEGTYDGAKHSITVTVSKPTSGATIYYSESKLTESNYKTTGSTTNPTYSDVCTKTIYYYVDAPNYSGYAGNALIKITSKTITSGVSISGINDKVYTGSAITQPELALKDTSINKSLVLNTDYTVTYTENKDVGTARLAIKGKGNYTGTVNKTFKITGDTVKITKNTEGLATEIKVTITKELSMTTLQYSFDNSSWADYKGVLSITEDGIIYARSIDKNNGNKVIGTAQLEIANICQHEYIPATCIKAAYCGLCGHVNGNPLGHTFTQELVGSRYLNTAATCTTNAIYNKKCIRCSEFTTAATFEDPGTKLGHDYNKKSGKVASAATCTEPEYCYYSCTRCDDVSTNTYANGNPLGHNSAKQSSKQRSAATCTAAATYYYCCSRCDTITDTSKYYSSGTALGHAFQTKTQKYLRSSATCTAAATYYFECNRCGVSSQNNDGSYYSYGNPIAHTYASKTTSTTYLKSAATCVDLAVYYYKCTGCDAKGTNTYTHGSVDSTNHVGGTTRHYTAPTTLATGREWYTCNSCGVTVSNTVIPKLSIYAVLCSDNVLEFNTTGTSTRGKSLKASGTSWVVTGTYTSASQRPWYNYATTITGVQVTEAISPESTAYWFYGCTNLASVGDLSKLDTSIVTNMANMFNGCSKLTSLDISDLTTTNVTNMAGMFSGCSGLTSLVVSTLNTAKVTDMNAMFKNCSSLLTLNISTFTTSAVTNMKEMFSGCTKLTTINLSNISTANVTNMASMFNNCSALTSLDVTGFNTAKVTNMTSMFYGCTALTTLDVSSFNTSVVTAMASMFGNCSKIEKIYASANFVTTALTDGGSSMFYGDTKLTGGSGTTYSASNVGKAYAKIDGGAASPGYFWSTAECTHAFEVQGNNYLKTAATCTVAPTYYYECALCGISSQGITNEYYSSGNALGHDCTIQSISNTYLKSAATCASPAVYYFKCSRCTAKGTGTYTYGSKDASNHVGGTTAHETPATETATGRRWTTCNGCGVELSSETIYLVFAKAIYSADDNSLRFYKNTDIVTAGSTYKGRVATAVYRGFETATYTSVSNVPWTSYASSITTITFENEIKPVSTAYWFAGFDNATSLSLTNLNTSSTTNMSYMFMDYACKVADVNLDLSGLNTSNVTNMSNMLATVGKISASSVKITGLDNWDTSKVTDMSALFNNLGSYATSITIDSVTNWNTSSVTTMKNMFSVGGNIVGTTYCSTFSIGDISKWNVSNVTDMSHMFSGFSSGKNVDLDLSSWNVSKVTNMNQMFTFLGCYAETINLNVSGWNVSKVTDFKNMFFDAGYSGKCKTINIVGMDNWDMRSATSLSGMFQLLGTSGTITNIGNIGNWNTSNVTNMNSMFNNSSVTTLLGSVLPLGDADANGITNAADATLILAYAAGNKTLSSKGLAVADVNGDGVINSKDATIVLQYSNGITQSYIPNAINWDTSKVTDMSYMFSGSKIEVLDLMNFNTSKVTTMNDMFSNVKYLEFVNLGENFAFVGNVYLPQPSSTYIKGADGYWYDTKDSTAYYYSNVPSNKAATYAAKPLNVITAIYSADDNGLYFYKIDTEDVPVVGGTYDGRTVTNIYKGFEKTRLGSAQQPWVDRKEDITKIIVKNTITPLYTNYWFYEMKNVTSVDVSKLDTSNVIEMDYMFGYVGYNSTSLTMSGFDTWDTSNVIDMQGMFAQCGYNANIFSLNLSGWDTSKVESMRSMFYYLGDKATKWELIGLENWDTSNVIDMAVMFCAAGRNAEKIDLDLSKWNLESCTRISDMFNSFGGNAETWSVGDLSGWNVSNVTTMYFTFHNTAHQAKNFSIGDLSGWDVSNVTGMERTFYGTGNSAETWSVGDLSGWNTSNVTNMTEMFGYSGFNTKNWSIGDISNWNTSNVTDMSQMFDHAGYNTNNWYVGDIGKWDVSNVGTMQEMFDYAGYNSQKFNLGDIGAWKTTKLTNVRFMFNGAGYNATTWSIGNLDDWDTSNISEMGNMFMNAAHTVGKFDIGDLSKWNTANVITFCDMFNGAGYNATTWNIGNIAGWNTGNATSMGYMFYMAGSKASYSQDLTGWDVSKVVDYAQFNKGVESKVTAPNWVN